MAYWNLRKVNQLVSLLRNWIPYTYCTQCTVQGKLVIDVFYILILWVICYLMARFDSELTLFLCGLRPFSLLCKPYLHWECCIRNSRNWLGINCREGWKGFSNFPTKSKECFVKFNKFYKKSLSRIGSRLENFF